MGILLRGMPGISVEREQSGRFDDCEVRRGEGFAKEASVVRGD